ncbi:MAG TPA: sulfotransferase domain-containing protein [Kiritimatiellia bacterium]|nr:sulfotransferase domain-containing protein [Kiritimatiellia bacterium]
MIDFIIIGTQRGGTHSFYEYLIQHPQVVPSLQPTVAYFDKHFSMGNEWYIEQFPLLSKYKDGERPKGHITGEASPYYMYHPLVPERVKRFCPMAKFIVLLRNPTDRAYSHFRMSVAGGHENLAFEFALKMEPKRLERGRFLMRDNPYHDPPNHRYHSYISHGMYARQLKHWMQYFRKDQFFVFRSEDYYANPVEYAMRAYKFLGLPDFTPDLMDPPYVNPYEMLTVETRKRIDKIFEKSNEDLCRLLGWSEAW